jgi:hypothetical protein
MGEKRNAYRILLGKPEGKRRLGRRRRWVDNIKMYLREIGYSPPTSAEVKKIWIYTSTPIRLHGVVLN